MPSFHGGPLDGSVGYDPSVDPSPDQLASSALPDPQQQGGAETGPSGGDAQSASQKFDRILADARDLAASDGNFSEADKLILEQITTLLQKLKASGEKNQQQALAGKMSPAVGMAYAGGAANGPGGY